MSTLLENALKIVLDDVRREKEERLEREDYYLAPLTVEEVRNLQTQQLVSAAGIDRDEDPSRYLDQRMYHKVAALLLRETGNVHASLAYAFGKKTLVA